MVKYFICLHHHVFKIGLVVCWVCGVNIDQIGNILHGQALKTFFGLADWIIDLFGLPAMADQAWEEFETSQAQS